MIHSPFIRVWVIRSLFPLKIPGQSADRDFKRYKHNRVFCFDRLVPIIKTRVCTNLENTKTSVKYYEFYGGSDGIAYSDILRKCAGRGAKCSALPLPPLVSFTECRLRPSGIISECSGGRGGEGLSRILRKGKIFYGTARRTTGTVRIRLDILSRNPDPTAALGRATVSRCPVPSHTRWGEWPLDKPETLCWYCYYYKNTYILL